MRLLIKLKRWWQNDPTIDARCPKCGQTFVFESKEFLESLTGINRICTARVDDENGYRVCDGFIIKI